jgi:hypothetical protein
MNGAFKKDSTFFKQIYMVTDTNCTKLKFHMDYISQAGIDSISNEMYNVTLLKRVNGNYVGRMIETEESPKILEVVKTFFSK